MDRLVPVLTQLQQVLTAVDSNSSRSVNIYLPQLVVVGSQSSGKTSVLENIVGRDFLPRGSNIVTRRPLVLTLHTLTTSNNNNNNNNHNHPSPDVKNTRSQPSTPDLHRPPAHDSNEYNEKPALPQEYGIFGHLPNQKFYDFQQIKQEIVEETDRVAVGQSISHEPIYLHVYSPTVPPLVLVDLPGITKVATGNQPEDIEQQIKTLVLKYITNPNSIIVAVSSAAEDLANSAALQIARQVDPQNQRTLGVLTKIDLMDKGTDAVSILQNRVIPLKLGYVGVINRSQKDINDCKLISESLLAEKEFFYSSPVYGPLASVLGTEYLTKRLSSLLFQHLQLHIPAIKQQIMRTIQETERELDAYGLPLIQQVLQSNGLLNGNNMFNHINSTDHDITTLNPTQLGPVLLDLLSKYASAFTQSLDGRSIAARSGHDLTTAELHGGARISFVFNEIFGREIEQISPFQTLTDFEIRTAMRNATGPRTTLFLPEIAFDLLVKQQIELLRHPALNCIDLVMEELTRMGIQCQTSNVPQLQHFPVLKHQILDTLQRLFDNCVIPTKAFIKNIVNSELAYINTSHPDFIGGARAMQQAINMRRGLAQQALLAAKERNEETTLEEQYQQLLLEDQQRFVEQSYGLDGYGEDDFDSQVINSAGHIITNNRPFGRFTTDKLKACRQQPPTERELVEIDVIKLLIESYFNIVKKTIKDIIPKAIMLMLVNKAKDEIQSELVKELYKESKFIELLTEAPEVAEQRTNCVQVIHWMRKALEIVHKINDTAL